MESEVGSTNLESVGRKKVSSCSPKRLSGKTKKLPRKKVTTKR